MKERELNRRVELLRHLAPSDFGKLERTASTDLGTLMELFRDGFNPDEEFSKAVTRKWCINLLVYLVLKGGGQRPQVYGCIKSPTMSELILMETQVSEHGYFTLITGVEKRPRPNYAPRFTLPESCFKYIQYHVQHVRPYLIGKRPQSVRGLQDCLLLDTRTAKNLSSSSVTPTRSI